MTHNHWCLSQVYRKILFPDSHTSFLTCMVIVYDWRFFVKDYKSIYELASFIHYVNRTGIIFIVNQVFLCLVHIQYMHIIISIFSVWTIINSYLYHTSLSHERLCFSSLIKSCYFSKIGTDLNCKTWKVTILQNRNKFNIPVNCSARTITMKNKKYEIM